MNELDDLSIDDLLDAALSKVKPMRSTTERLIDNEVPSWNWIPITFFCTKCKRQYKGLLFHPSNDNYTKPGDTNYTPWCPRCIDEALWWLHSKFEVQEVIEPESD